MKTVLFLILDQFAEFESAYLSSAIKMLGQNDYDIKTVSLTKNNVKSIGGFNVVPDYDILSVPDNYEALILIGGMSWRNDYTKKIKPLIDDCLAKNKVLAAICDATVFLGAIGALNEVKHTSNEINDLKQWAKEKYTGEKNYIMKQAVRDHGIITANGTATLEFAKEVLLELNVTSEDKIAEWYNFHKLGFYNAPMPKM